jgi:hypothetical protein
MHPGASGPSVDDWRLAAATQSFAALRSRVVEGGAAVYSRGKKKDLDEHLEMIRQEFVGRSELELHHAVLIVLVRRGIDLQHNLQRLRALWEQEAGYLCARLDGRWLVSACDTIMDHWSEGEERALAAAASILGNTIKLYETERWALGMGRPAGDYAPIQERVALPDGMSAFVIGRGDMVANLHRRLQSLARRKSPAAAILLELLYRASEQDTVYGRFRRVHRKAETAWGRPTPDPASP